MNNDLVILAKRNRRFLIYIISLKICLNIQLLGVSNISSQVCMELVPLCGNNMNCSFSEVLDY